MTLPGSTTTDLVEDIDPPAQTTTTDSEAAGCAVTDIAGGTAEAHQAGDEQRPESTAPDTPRPRRWTRITVFALMPTLVMLIAGTTAYLKYQATAAHERRQAAIESVQAARDATVALLSYQPDKVEQQLGDAGKLLTGTFKDSYNKLIHDVVIPGAKERHISAQANVPAAGSVSATPQRAAVMVFVDQTVIVGDSAPTNTASSVRVTLTNDNGRWLISGFDPI